MANRKKFNKRYLFLFVRGKKVIGLGFEVRGLGFGVMVRKSDFIDTF